MVTTGLNYILSIPLDILYNSIAYYCPNTFWSSPIEIFLKSPIDFTYISISLRSVYLFIYDIVPIGIFYVYLINSFLGINNYPFGLDILLAY